jgi:hypothetical protein
LKTYDENDAYSALDWLLEKQTDIQRRLASRHLNDGDLVFLDMSSSYYEGGKSTLVSMENSEQV